MVFETKSIIDKHWIALDP